MPSLPIFQSVPMRLAVALMCTFASARTVTSQEPARRPADSSAKTARQLADSTRTAVADSVRKASRTRRQRERVRRHRPVTAEVLRTAFADSSARILVGRARAARLLVDSTIVSYDAKTYQRLSVGMNLGRIGRDRLFMRTESAARVRWQRDVGLWVDIKGARTALPSMLEVKGDVDFSDIAPIPYFPGREALWFPASEMGIVAAAADDESFIHPITDGAEAYYKYASGDTAVITLPTTGERILLRELRVTARRADWKLFVGSFWFDDRRAQLVKAAYRVSVEMDLWAMDDEDNLRHWVDDSLPRVADAATVRRPGKSGRRANDDNDQGAPLVVKGMLSPMKGTVSAIMVEYGLHDGRVWLPRAHLAEGSGQLSLMRIPFKLEEKFTYSSVNALDVPLPPLPVIVSTGDDTTGGADSLARSGGSVTINFGIGGGKDSRKATDSVPAAGDSSILKRPTRLAERERQCATDSSWVRTERRYEGRLQLAVRIPCDKASLAQSPDLPRSIYEEGETVFSATDRDELLAALDQSLQPGFEPQPPQLHTGLNLMRYNRVEGLSAGGQATMALGSGYAALLRARLGVADLQPNAELAVSRSNGRTAYTATVYRRLVAANDWGSPLAFGNSINALLFGRDEGFYYRTAGAEATGVAWQDRLTWRLFAEQQWTASQKTQWSLPRAIHGHRFIPNIDARRGEIAGVSGRWFTTLGRDPQRLRLLSDARAEAAAGSFDYGRGALDLTLSRGLGRHLSGALTAGAGTSGGSVPPQRLWYLGDAHTVRGQSAGTLVGDAYWLGRAELGTAAVALKPIVFADLGWAGSRKRWSTPGRPASGAGVGASFGDGLIRADLSHGIYPRRRLRFDLYVESRF